MISDDLRSRLESAINRHLEWPDSENLGPPILEDVIREIERIDAEQVTYVRDPEHPERERLPTAYSLQPGDPFTLDRGDGRIEHGVIGDEV